jgi:dipeptidyl aminopeptidase/acylaminoacyl peptidase
VATGLVLLKFDGYPDWVRSAAFSPDGKTIVTASVTARIWDAATGKELQKLQGHTEFVISAKFSPDGKTVVTASRDKTARIWDAATGKELQKLQGHGISVQSTEFSPDGKTIVTASGDNTARIWNRDMVRQRLEREEQAERERKAKREQEKAKREQEERERIAKEEASFILLQDYLKNEEFKENELWKLVRYGTKDLQSQFEKADEFDKPALKKQIEVKQNEIKVKKFVLTLT